MDDGGWIGDTIWGGENDIDRLLKMMTVEVETESIAEAQNADT